MYKDNENIMPKLRGVSIIVNGKLI